MRAGCGDLMLESVSLPPRPVVPSAQLRRFAATHLRSRPARAVYAIVAGGPDRPWSAAEVARHSALDVHEVDRVLRRFAAAGIVEAAAGGRGWRYRWAPGMAYLFDDSSPGVGPDAVVDPVCVACRFRSTRRTGATGPMGCRCCSARSYASSATTRRPGAAGRRELVAAIGVDCGSTVRPSADPSSRSLRF